MRSMLLLVLFLAGCGGLAWNTTLADHPQVRDAMVSSVVPGSTTEMRFRTQWGNPTQKIREGGQEAWIYRNMTNPPGYYMPQFGDSSAYVVVVFQYGVAVDVYSSDMEGCRATFAPRPPGAHYPNPATVKPVNCGVPPGADAGRDKGLMTPIREATGMEAPAVPAAGPGIGTPGADVITDDSYYPGGGGKYR